MSKQDQRTAITKKGKEIKQTVEKAMMMISCN